MRAFLLTQTCKPQGRAMAERCTTFPEAQGRSGARLQGTRPHSPARSRYQAGVWAAPLALAPGFVLSGLLGVPTPLEPVAESIMQVTPVSIANILLDALGPLAPTAALLGAIAVTLPAGGLLALAAPDPGPSSSTDGDATSHARQQRTTRWLLTTLLAVLVVVPLVADAAYQAQAAGALLTGIAYSPALALAQRAQHTGERASIAADADLSRRAFVRGVIGSGVTVVAALTLGSFGAWSSALSRAVGRSEASRELFPFTPPGPRHAGFPIAGVEQEVTPVSRFYLLSKNDVDPAIQPDDWYLRVTGAVNRPLTVTYAALLALPRTEAYVTLRCVNNPPAGHLMSTAYWSGVPIAALLSQAGMAADATSIVLRAPDAYDELIPLHAAVQPGALLAYGMNGQTLPQRHGGPVRALIPGFFGFKNVKWVNSLEVTRVATAGYWAQRGWTAGQIHSVARIDIWKSIGGGVLVAGVAFCGDRGVSSVQVRADGGSWQNAALNVPALSPESWVLWRATLALRPGTYTVAARVIDGTGRAQDATPAGVYPDGATGLDVVQVTV